MFYQNIVYQLSIELTVLHELLLDDIIADVDRIVNANCYASITVYYYIDICTLYIELSVLYRAFCLFCTKRE